MMPDHESNRRALDETVSRPEGQPVIGPPKLAATAPVAPHFPLPVGDLDTELESPLRAGQPLGDVSIHDGATRVGPAATQLEANQEARLLASTLDLEQLGPEGAEFGNYKLLERIAEGGMGVVYRAHHRTLNRIVAVKIMKGGGQAKRRFFTEAEASANLKHPFLVNIHEIGEVAGYPYYSMDYIAGKPLDQHNEQHGWSGRSLLMAKVAEAAHYFHTRGIIHRDLKPDNILIDDTGNPKVIDFGVAKLMGRHESKIGTQEGTIIGTPNYMSPEQAEGEQRDIDTRSDVYALGAIFYQLLSGVVPFEGKRIELVILAITSREPKPISQICPDVPWELVAIVAKAMEKDRNARYQTALDFKADIERYLRDEPIKARQATWYYRAVKLLKRRKKFFALAGTIAALVVSLISYTGYREYHGVIERQRAGEKLARAEAAEAREAGKSAEIARRLALQQAEAARRAERAAKAQSKLQQELLQRKLEQQTLQTAQDEKLRMAQEEAKRRAEEEALAQSRATVAVLLKRPRDDKLSAVNNLSQALAFVPAQDEQLSQRIEALKLTLVVELSEQAIRNRQLRFARYWIDQARNLKRALLSPPAKTKLHEVEASIGALQREIGDLGRVERAIVAKAWLEARSLLRLVQRTKLNFQELAKLRSLVDRGCASLAEVLIAKARGKILAGQASSGMDIARHALKLRPKYPPSLSLIHDAAAQLGLKAQAEAASLSLRPESRSRALSILAAAAERTRGTAIAVRLRLEHQHRRRLIHEPALKGFCYVPGVAALKTPPLFFGRTEVTRQQFQGFVDARGHEQDELWSPLVSRSSRLKRQHEWKARPPSPDNFQRPVTGVTWDEARAYTRWLSLNSRQTFRLPTVREWEIAAGWSPVLQRLQIYPWGDRFDLTAVAGERSLPELVGRNPHDRSAFGLLDLAASVAEWVVEGGFSKPMPAAKGGDYLSDSEHLRHFARVTFLSHPAPNPRATVARRIGFRVVLVP